MKRWLPNRVKAWILFLAIAALVVGGLGWVTAEVLRLEEARNVSDFDKELSGQLSLALWRLDSRIAPALAREDSRPYDHYAAFAPPPLLFRNDGSPVRAGEIMAPSPLVSADLPPWMLLHFQADAEVGWGSPQVLSQSLVKVLDDPKVKAPLDNVTDGRCRLLIDLAGCLPPRALLDKVETRCAQLPALETTLVPSLQNAYPNDPEPIQMLKEQQEFARGQKEGGQKSAYNNEANNNLRGYTQMKVLREGANPRAQTTDLGVALGNMRRNGEGWLAHGPVAPARGQKAVVNLGPMVPLWLTPEGRDEHLVVARLVKVGEKQFCQGIVLDWESLQLELAAHVADLFPEARLVPMRDAEPARPERAMKWLPVELDPGPVAPEPLLAWTALRVGLAMAWASSLIGLAAVGLGGRSLLELSERRIRFVSAVTHELRTPLTTLRLYLDMLTGGMVQEEAQKTEYLQTLHSETERLNRLVANVLDFSRLEGQRPRLNKTPISLAALLEQVQTDWQERCKSTDKELVIDCSLPEDAALTTDVKLVQQVLGNLIDNACKYSRGADDCRIILRARLVGSRLALEVEDRGPGVAPRERQGIFRAFRRGGDADVTAGGVGLGLALARRWGELLGGRLSLLPATGSGACFRLELPGLAVSRPK